MSSIRKASPVDFVRFNNNDNAYSETACLAMVVPCAENTAHSEEGCLVLRLAVLNSGMLQMAVWLTCSHRFFA